MDPLTQHLEAMLGAGATFRDGQREAIEAVIQDGHRALVVQRTGWGKSLVYWIATRVRRDQGHRVVVLVRVRLGLGPIDRPRGVLRRGINGVQPKIRRTRV